MKERESHSPHPKEEKIMFERILWSINPFDRNPKALKAVEAALGLFKDSEVQPLFVMSPQEFHYFRDLKFSKWKSPKPMLPETIAEEQIQTLLKKSPLKKILPAKILPEKDDSSQIKAKRLVEYAETQRFSLIALSTHARKGLMRLFMGSFAETLLLTGFDAVLFVNPQTRAVKKVKSILYPTDFSASSRAGYEKALELASYWGARVEVFFAKAPPQIYNYSVVAEGSIIPYLMLHESEDIEKWSKEYLDLAKKKNITARFTSKPSFDSAETSILKHAKSLKTDMIFMQARKHDAVTNFFGSTIRGVVRSANCPVIALR